jgi:hypothetical protein
MPPRRAKTTGLTDYFDKEVGWDRSPSLGNQRAGDLAPKLDPKTIRRFEKYKQHWVPGVPGYDAKKDHHSEEYKNTHLMHHRKAKKAPQKKHKRTEQERQEHLAKMKEWSEKVQDEHQNAMRIFMSANAFQSGEDRASILSALEYINRKLAEFTGIRRGRVISEKARGLDPKTTRANISAALADERTPPVNPTRLGSALTAIETYFDSEPVFKDHYKVHKPPHEGMTFLSTAILYFKTVKHQIMKAAVHKTHHLASASPLAREFLHHNEKAAELLAHMHKGWKAHLLKPRLPNAEEHNKYLKHVMHSKFHEWKAGHPNEKTPSYVRRFDPEFIPHVPKTNPQPERG